MSSIPKDRGFDHSLALLKEGYAFIPARCRKYRSELFETRLMLKRVVCMSGADAARQFYRPDQFTRRRGMPQPSFALIQDNGSVMVLDGEAHRVRKAMFLSLMSPAALKRLAELTEQHWRKWAQRWQGKDKLPLFDAAHVPLCGAVCEWAGIPLDDGEVEKRAREFKAMVEGTGSVGPRHLRGHLLRALTESRMRGVIEQVRAGERHAAEGTAVRIIAEHRDHQGKPLDVKVAAVELINVLRATVANARYITFAALALHDHPEAGDALRSGDDSDLEHFVHEVRRFFPFIPFIDGRVLEPFEWRGHLFAKDDWVLMDIYGTNQDPAAWDIPDQFRPSRFRDRKDSAFDFVPQGGGEHGPSHRCPGEWITIVQMKTISRLLARDMHYRVPEQDLTIDLGRMPALPRSRFVIADVLI